MAEHTPFIPSADGTFTRTTSGQKPTVKTAYASIAAMLADLNAGGLAAAFIDTDKPAPDKAYRATLGMLTTATAGQTMDEDVYLVTPQVIGGVSSIRLERVGVIQWTAGSVEIDAGLVGELLSRRESSAAVLTNDGLLGARTGSPAAAVSRQPASVELPDIGECKGILRVITRGTATAGYALHRLWR